MPIKAVSWWSHIWPGLFPKSTCCCDIHTFVQGYQYLYIFHSNQGNKYLHTVEYRYIDVLIFKATKNHVGLK